MDAKKLGAFIAELRKEKNMTQAELAKKIQVTDKAVSKWERGLGLPDINNIEPLADALGVSILEIMQCRRNPVEEIKTEDATEIVSSVFDIAKQEKKIDFKKTLIGFIFGMLGGILIFLGTHFKIHSASIGIIGGADGPTSIFLAGKFPSAPNTIIVIIGIVCLVICLVKLFRKR